MNLAQLKFEAKRDLRDADFSTSMSNDQYHVAQGFLETLIDKVVDAVEADVVGQIDSDKIGSSLRYEVREAFRNFRSV